MKNFAGCPRCLAFGHLGYDKLHQLEKLLPAPHPPVGFQPDPSEYR
jgi:hypothetical protein